MTQVSTISKIKNRFNSEVLLIATSSAKTLQTAKGSQVALQALPTLTAQQLCQRGPKDLPDRVPPKVWRTLSPKVRKTYMAVKRRGVLAETMLKLERGYLRKSRYITDYVSVTDHTIALHINDLSSEVMIVAMIIHWLQDLHKHFGSNSADYELLSLCAENMIEEGKHLTLTQLGGFFRILMADGQLVYQVEKGNAGLGTERIETVTVKLHEGTTYNNLSNALVLSWLRKYVEALSAARTTVKFEEKRKVENGITTIFHTAPAEAQPRISKTNTP